MIGIILLVGVLVGCSDDTDESCQKDRDCSSGQQCISNTCISVRDQGPGKPDLGAVDRGVKPEQGADKGVDMAGGPDTGGQDQSPPDQSQPDKTPLDLPGPGATCSGDTPCATGYCVDGYCCDKACAGTCQACNLSGKEGTCSPISLGADPDSECSGSAECGGDVCDGTGKCAAFKSTKMVCESKCQSGGVGKVEERFCDGAGTCSAAFKARSCSPYLCNGNTGKCATGCATHKECVTTSVCDRRLAHVNGLGICVPPAKVAGISTSSGLKSMLAQIKSGSTSKTYIRLAGGTYAGEWKIEKPTKVSIIGTLGWTFLSPPSANPTPSAISITAGAEVYLQEVRFRDSNYQGVQ